MQAETMHSPPVQSKGQHRNGQVRCAQIALLPFANPTALVHKGSAEC